MWSGRTLAILWKPGCQETQARMTGRPSLSPSVSHAGLYIRGQHTAQSTPLILPQPFPVARSLTCPDMHRLQENLVAECQSSTMQSHPPNPYLADFPRIGDDIDLAGSTWRFRLGYLGTSHPESVTQGSGQRPAWVAYLHFVMLGICHAGAWCLGSSTQWGPLTEWAGIQARGFLRWHLDKQCSQKMQCGCLQDPAGPCPGILAAPF